MTMKYAVEVRASTQRSWVAVAVAVTVDGDRVLVMAPPAGVPPLGGSGAMTNGPARRGHPPVEFLQPALSVGDGAVRLILEPVPITAWRADAVRIAGLRPPEHPGR